MKKESKFAHIQSMSEALALKKDLVHQLAAFRISSDASVIKTEGGISGLRRSLRSISRKVAIFAKQGSVNHDKT
jgi:hypothetical protein